MRQFDVMKAFSENLRRELDERGLTIKELADMCGILRPNLSRIVHGHHNVTLETACRISDALGMPITDLLEHPVGSK